MWYTGVMGKRSQSHCVKSHEFTEENTYWYESRGVLVRQCRACQRDRESQRTAKKPFLCVRCKQNRPRTSFPPDPLVPIQNRTWCEDCDYTKFCLLCDRVLPVERFGIDNGASDGLTRSCKSCVEERRKDRLNSRPRVPSLAQLEREAKIAEDRTLFEQGFKRCFGCDQNVPIENFRKNRSGRFGLSARCKPCELPKAETSPEERRNIYLKHSYRLTQKQFASLLEIQNGKCFMCPSPPSPAELEQADRYWHVDHDHACCPGARSCGRCVRGILCRRHNLLLGAYENIDRESALQYLEDPPFRRLMSQAA